VKCYLLPLQIVNIHFAITLNIPFAEVVSKVISRFYQKYSIKSIEINQESQLSGIAKDVKSFLQNYGKRTDVFSLSTETELWTLRILKVKYCASKDKQQIHVTTTFTGCSKEERNIAKFFKRLRMENQYCLDRTQIQTSFGNAVVKTKNEEYYIWKSLCTNLKVTNDDLRSMKKVAQKGFDFIRNEVFHAQNKDKSVDLHSVERVVHFLMPIGNKLRCQIEIEDEIKGMRTVANPAHEVPIFRLCGTIVRDRKLDTEIKFEFRRDMQATLAHAGGAALGVGYNIYHTSSISDNDSNLMPPPNYIPPTKEKKKASSTSLEDDLKLSPTKSPLAAIVNHEESTAAAAAAQQQSEEGENDICDIFRNENSYSPMQQEDSDGFIDVDNNDNIVNDDDDDDNDDDDYDDNQSMNDDDRASMNASRMAKVIAGKTHNQAWTNEVREAYTSKWQDPENFEKMLLCWTTGRKHSAPMRKLRLDLAKKVGATTDKEGFWVMDAKFDEIKTMIQQETSKEKCLEDMACVYRVCVKTLINLLLMCVKLYQSMKSRMQEGIFVCHFCPIHCVPTKASEKPMLSCNTAGRKMGDQKVRGLMEEITEGIGKTKIKENEMNLEKQASALNKSPPRAPPPPPSIPSPTTPQEKSPRQKQQSPSHAHPSPKTPPRARQSEEMLNSEENEKRSKKEKKVKKEEKAGKQNKTASQSKSHKHKKKQRITTVSSSSSSSESEESSTDTTSEEYYSSSSSSDNERSRKRTRRAHHQSKRRHRRKEKGKKRKRKSSYRHRERRR